MLRRRIFSQRGIEWDVPLRSVCSGRTVTRERSGTYGCILALLVSLSGIMLVSAGVHGWGSGVFQRLMVSDYTTEDMRALALFLCLALLFAGTIVLMRLAFFTTYRLAISKTNVSFTVMWRTRVLLNWSEPLSQYEGLLLETIEEPGGSGKKPCVYAILQLRHQEPEKSITFEKVPIPAKDAGGPGTGGQGGGAFRRTWESYARALELRTLERDPQGAWIRRSFEELDVPLSEWVREAPAADWRRDAPPPALRVEDKGDSLCVTMEIPRVPMRVHIIIGVAGGILSVPLILGFTLFPLGVAGAIRWALPPVPEILAWYGAVLFTLIFYSVLGASFQSMRRRARMSQKGVARKMAVVRNFLLALELDTASHMRKTTGYGESRLTITPQSVVLKKITANGATALRQTRLNAYEEIRVTHGAFVCGITLIGDAGSFWVRTPSRAAAEWIRDAILSVATGAQESDGGAT